MDHIIEHHKFQEALKQIALEQDLKLEDVKKQGANCIKELYAQQHPMAKLMSVKGFDFILSRAYNDKIMRSNSTRNIIFFIFTKYRHKKTHETHAEKLCCVYHDT